METIIAGLVKRFETGALSRRELVQGLTTLAAAGGAASEAHAQEAAGNNVIKGAKGDHISIQVTDLPRAIAFYQRLFGFVQGSEDKPNEIVRLGAAGKTLVSLP